MPRKERIDHDKIKAEVAKYTEGGKVWKVMACGHREYVFLSVDEKTEPCWACARPTGK